MDGNVCAGMESPFLEFDTAPDYRNHKLQIKKVSICNLNVLRRMRSGRTETSICG